MKKSLKRILTMMLVGILILCSITACGKTSNEDTDTSTKQGRTKEEVADRIKEKMGKDTSDESDTKDYGKSNTQNKDRTEEQSSDEQTSESVADNTPDDTVNNNSGGTSDIGNIDVDKIKENIVNFVVVLDGVEIDLKDKNSYTIQDIMNMGYEYQESSMFENVLGKEIEPDQYTMSELFKNSEEKMVYLSACNASSSNLIFENCPLLGISGNYSSYSEDETPDFYIKGVDSIRLGSNFTVEQFDAIFDNWEYEIYKYDSEDGTYHTRTIQVPRENYYGDNEVSITFSDGYITDLSVDYM